ncbi:uncharacterized protein LOC129919489 [Episyrphus balteatus]|uniref:uncharacterized protein LOC129919489 n=1 Tax=Episyrphus balteatus TaxID=286459 RepID=UPI002485B150|nr:uncharacterized protein LOC129919489 [Episyrphus balteatus]
MGLPMMIVSRSIILWMLLGFIKCQDPQNYFFTPSSQGQNRFVPSYQNSRTPSFIGGSRNSLTSAASSYPEQLIFLNNDDGQSVPQSQLTTGFSPFAQHLPLQQTTRNPDYYDISPRPFGSPTASQGFNRPKALRATGSSGFIPLNAGRTNVPHQQTHFLQHFNEQQNVPISSPAAATSNFQSNRINGGGRPFGSGGSSSSNTGNSGFTRNRPFGGTQYNRQNKQQTTTNFDDELVTPPQQQLPFRNTRTRFQPSSAKTSTATTTTSSTTSKPSRYNRFGGARSPSTQSSSSEFRQTIGSSSSSPSRGRLPITSSSVNKTLFQPRRPVIISRESNRPFGGIGSTGGRIQVNHNGSDKGSPNNTNSLEEDDLDESVEDDSVPEEIREQNHVSPGPKEEIFEKLSLHEAGASLPPSSSSNEHSSPDEKHQHDQPVILTSNFYLPGADDEEEGAGGEELVSHSGEEEVENSKEGSASKEHQIQDTTHHLPEYDYEYEDGKVTSTQSAETELTEPATEMEQNTEAKEQEAKEDPPKTELPTESEAPAVEVTTMSTQESTAFYDEEEYEDGYGSGVNGSGEDGSGVDGSGAEGHIEDGSGEHKPKHKSEHKSEEYNEDNTDKQPNNGVFGREVVSVVTTKSVINGSTALPQPVTPSTTTTREEEIYTENKLTPAKEITEDLEESEGEEAESAEEQNVQNTTESYVVIASIQTSRSINGARFLPFPAIEQEETKQTLSELERKIHGKNSRKKTPLSANDSNETGSSGEMDESSSSNTTISSTSESPVAEDIEEEEKEDKEEEKVEKVVVETTTQATTSTTASRFVPNIRKFQPKGSSKPKINTEDLPMDDLTGLLPPGFKPRPSFKNKKLNKPTTTTPEPSTSAEEHRKPHRNSTTGRSFKNSPNAAQDVSLAGILPKGYRTNHATVPPTEPPTKKIEDLLSKIKFEDSLETLVPSDYKVKATTPKAPVTFVDDISKFLPPGFKLPATTTTKPIIKVADDISKFLPPGFKPPAEEEKPELKVAVADDLSKFLPPGFKLDKAPKPEAIDISKLIPKDFKLPTVKEPTVVKKTESIDASEVKETTTEKATTKAIPSTTAAPSGGLKVVFPKGFNNRRPGHRITTPHANSAEGPVGPTQPSIVIKKGPPMRQTTEFTGWPTPSTTPISIEKLLEQARTATVDISELSPQTTTESTTSTSSTTTTTPEPPRPTKPGHCKSDCDLAGTIKIIDGVSWKPELLDHNTAEWKNLAREVEAQLNEVYSSAPHLSQWYKKVRIDSFSKGSVLVDYFVELGNITQDVNTLEIKKLFHQALTQPPLPVVPLQPEIDEDNETDSQKAASHEGKGEKLVKETYLMGRFVVDPSSTDFIVIPKSFAPTVEFAEDEALIPHWAIVLIVIGIGSLCFVVIFGVTVLINRQKNSKKTPIPLTADMMNDLKVSHMGGADNYGVDDFYNIDDAWNDTKQPIKPKRFTNSVHGSSASNIYDSWRSTRHGDYYYDSHNYTPHHNKADQYPPDAFADVHQMYTYNNPRSRYQRDYDPDF